MVYRMNLNGRGAGIHGDQTTTGATCLSSQTFHTQDGVPHLRLGDATTPCPQCGQAGQIAEGYNSWTIDGLPIAVDGAQIDCGCPPGSNRLMAPFSGVGFNRGASPLLQEQREGAGSAKGHLAP